MATRHPDQLIRMGPHHWDRLKHPLDPVQYDCNLESFDDSMAQLYAIPKTECKQMQGEARASSHDRRGAPQASTLRDDAQDTNDVRTIYKQRGCS